MIRRLLLLLFYVSLIFFVMAQKANAESYTYDGWTANFPVGFCGGTGADDANWVIVSATLKDSVTLNTISGSGNFNATCRYNTLGTPNPGYNEGPDAVHSIARYGPQCGGGTASSGGNVCMGSCTLPFNLSASATGHTASQTWLVNHEAILANTLYPGGNGHVANYTIYLDPIAPTSTPTPVPTATGVPVPTATGVPVPTATRVPQPTVPQPTATPIATPTPSGPVSLSGQAVCSPNDGSKTSLQTITATWNNVGAASYQPDLKQGGTSVGGINCTTNTIWPFSGTYSNTTSYTVGVTAYSGPSCSGSIVTSQYGVLVTNAVCNGPTPTPTPIGPTATPAPGCAPNPPYGCVTSINPGCTIAGGAPTVWCQNNVSASSMCQYCPITPTAPPPVSCMDNTYRVPNDAPTAVLQPDGHTVKVSYSTAFENCDDEGNCYTVSGGATLWRSTQYGFIGTGSEAKIGTQFGGYGKYWYYPGNDQNTAYYYQLQAQSGSQSALSNTTGVIARVAPDSWSSCSTNTQYAPSLKSAAQVSHTATTVTFDLKYISSSYDGSYQAPPNLQLTNTAGNVSYTPWVIPYTNYCYSGSCGSCNSATCYYMLTARYTIDLPPNTNDTYTMRGYTDSCLSDAHGQPSANLSTIDGTAPDVKIATLSASPDLSRVRLEAVVNMSWPQIQPGEQVNVYQSETRWPEDVEIATTTSYNSQTTKTTFTGYDDLGNLDPGTYYYGAEASSNPGYYCYLPTDQAAFPWTGYSVQGNVFVDSNKDDKKQAGENNYTGGQIIVEARKLANGIPDAKVADTSTTSDGTYTLHLGSKSSYQITYTNVSDSGYNAEYPVGSYTVHAGKTNCSFSPDKTYVPPAPNNVPNDASCDGNGNINNLNFAIATLPWFQGKGGDMRLDGGFTNIVGNNANPKYTVLNGAGGSPGVLFAGSGTFNFGVGSASSKGWQVGSTANFSGESRTSYGYLMGTVTLNKVTPAPVPAACNNSDVVSGGCAISAIGTNGIFKSDSALYLNASNFSTGKSMIILVNGDVHIKGDILVPSTSTSTLTISASGDIIVENTVGKTDTSSTAPDVEGFYSADKSVKIKSYDINGTGGNCPATADKRLNVGGLLVANAKKGPDSFKNDRDLCSNNSTYPSVYIIERPDFVINAPAFLRRANFIWQETAP